MFFVIDENNNKIEAYDKEGVLAVLSKAIKDGSLSGISADAGFVSKLKCCVTGGTSKVAFVTQAKYNELKASNGLLENCLYYITDDTTAEDMDKALQDVNKALQELNDLLIVDGMAIERKKLLLNETFSVLLGSKTLNIDATTGDVLEIHWYGQTGRGITRVKVMGEGSPLTFAPVITTGTSTENVFSLEYLHIVYTGNGAFSVEPRSVKALGGTGYTATIGGITKIYKVLD